MENARQIVLTEVPVEKLDECVGFTYRWLGINADLRFLKRCIERNPSEYYWLDCICVPQDAMLPAKLKEISNMRTYYSQFKRVTFLGRLELTTHSGIFKLVRNVYFIQYSFIIESNKRNEEGGRFINT